MLAGLVIVTVAIVVVVAWPERRAAAVADNRLRSD